MIMALAIAAAYILGLWWCYEVICRFPQNVKEIFQLKQVTRTIAIIFVWIITVPLALALIFYGFVIMSRLVWFVQTM
jgi:hypothetical protein